MECRLPATASAWEPTPWRAQEAVREALSKAWVVVRTVHADSGMALSVERYLDELRLEHDLHWVRARGGLHAYDCESGPDETAINRPYSSSVLAFRHREEIQRDQILGVVRQKRAPHL